MADLPARIQEPAAEILLILSDEFPIAAQDLSNLFGALARDYKRSSRGRTLIVAGFTHGSLIVHLTDAYKAVEPYLYKAVDTAKAAKALADFVKTIKDATDRFRKKGKPSGKPKAVGDRSAIEIFKIASKTGRAVEFRHQSADGEITEVRIGPEDAAAAINLPAQLRDQTDASRVTAATRALSRFSDLHSQTPEQIGEAILTISSLDGPYLTYPAKAVIEAVKSALALKGANYLLSQIGAYLTAKGRGDLARLVSKSSEPLQEPPLLT